MKTKRLVTDALCAAIYVFLASFASIKMGPMTISVDGLPILLGAMLFGPVDGIIIGALGGFISQLIGYGLMPTTIIWMLPPIALGAVTGVLAKVLPWKEKNYGYSAWRVAIMVVIGLVCDTTVTTGVSWLDCVIYQYSFAYYIPLIAWRYLADVAKTVIYTAILPVLVLTLQRAHVVPGPEKTADEMKKGV